MADLLIPTSSELADETENCVYFMAFLGDA
jgi:hypothetical protein